jgi:hypothetical protein
MLASDAREKKQPRCCPIALCAEPDDALHVVRRVRWICEQNIVLRNAPLGHCGVKVFALVDDDFESERVELSHHRPCVLAREERWWWWWW